MLRWSEWVAAGFLTYATIMAPFPKTFLLNAILVLGFLLIIRQPASRNWRVIRDWYPLALVPLAYWQMGWTGDGYVYHGLERSWVAFDKVLLVNWGLKDAIESLGPVIPGLLELSYTLVYPIPPVCLGLVYLFGRRASSDSPCHPISRGDKKEYPMQTADRRLDKAYYRR